MPDPLTVLVGLVGTVIGGLIGFLGQGYLQRRRNRWEEQRQDKLTRRKAIDEVLGDLWAFQSIVRELPTACKLVGKEHERFSTRLQTAYAKTWTTMSYRHTTLDEEWKTEVENVLKAGHHLPVTFGQALGPDRSPSPGAWKQAMTALAKFNENCSALRDRKY